MDSRQYLLLIQTLTAVSPHDIVCSDTNVCGGIGIHSTLTPSSSSSLPPSLHRAADSDGGDSDDSDNGRIIGTTVGGVLGGVLGLLALLGLLSGAVIAAPITYHIRKVTRSVDTGPALITAIPLTPGADGSD